MQEKTCNKNAEKKNPLKLRPTGCTLKHRNVHEVLLLLAVAVRDGRVPININLQL